MPFGKFKGVRVEELEIGYLEWLVENIRLRGSLRVAVETEYHRRLRLEDDSSINHVIVDEIVGAGVRSLARKHPPDMGGDHGRMVLINRAAEWIRQQARRIAG
jgi:hypothetical protein